ncbi:MAG: hypothetical protein OXG94_09775 [Bacteroidetes bacterium]|nr:hypothetical protein [Bacteroidota bacterium]
MKTVVMRVPLVVLASVFLAASGYAQQSASVVVEVEIEAPALTLSVSSARLNFGRVGADAESAELDPSTGIQSTDRQSVYSVAGIKLTGQPSHTFLIQVTPPAFQPQSDNMPVPRYDLAWAQSAACEGDGFERLPALDILEGTIGSEGCMRYRFGGKITANAAPPGIYKGTMTITVSQI